MGEHELNDCNEGEYENILPASSRRKWSYVYLRTLDPIFFKATATFILVIPIFSNTTPPRLCPTPNAFLILTGHQEPRSCLEGLRVLPPASRGNSQLVDGWVSPRATGFFF
jgi:hypothetical protein